MIALIAHLKSKGEAGPHLVIVPSSTLENWMREFSVFAPELNVESYYGSQAERNEIRHELREMEDLDVVVTTYNIATSSPEDQKFLKKKMDFKVRSLCCTSPSRHLVDIFPLSHRLPCSTRVIRFARTLNADLLINKLADLLFIVFSSPRSSRTVTRRSTRT